MKQAIRKFTHFQSLKRQEIDMEGNFVDSDKATENSNFSKGVNDFSEKLKVHTIWSIRDDPWSWDPWAGI